MCTKARLVQGGQTSDWTDFHAENASFANVMRLQGDQPAFLEVSIDPAAHGPAGMGHITRGVMLKTADGKELDFELAANIVP